jgi:hypothetical protein
VEQSTGLINLASSSPLTSAFTASAFSFDILWSFYFPRRMDGSVLRLCSIIVQLTPIRSKADQAKTSLLRLRQDSSLDSSSVERSSPIRTVWFGTEASSGTFLTSSLLWICAFIGAVFKAMATRALAFSGEAMHIALT